MSDGVVIAGSGLAGSLLALAIADTDPDRRVLLVDPADRPTRGRRWAFFEPDDDRLPDALTGRRYAFVRVTGPASDLLLPLHRHHYRVVDGDALDAAVDAALAGRGARCRARVTGADRDGVCLGASTVRAEVVIDCVGVIGGGSVAADPLGWLHFTGWRVTADRPVFDPTVVTLMDFLVPQHDQVRFVYVLPDTDRQALVELTSFTTAADAPAGTEADLAEYLDARLGVGRWHAAPAERGRLPLDPARRRPRQTRRGAAPSIVTAGSAAGMVKASTGYGARSMRRDARALAVDLAARRRLRGLPRRARHRWLDAVFLHLAVTDPAALRGALLALFAANPLDRVADFLNEETTRLQEARIIATLPPQPFLAAALSSPTRR